GEPRHLEVGEDDIHGRALELALGIGHPRRPDHLEAARPQDLEKGVSDVGLVLDDQQPRPRRLPGLHAEAPGCAGKLMRKTAPPPARARTRSSPPCSRTMEWQTESPSPVESWVEKNGSNTRCRSASATPGPRSATSTTTRPPSCRDEVRTSPP